ncbi:MAG: ATP synthase F1 subunit epsilon [Thermotogae bacterium]|nr:ATP synthase F1 subunit epsilon [Thermotogota bacterium]
MAFHLQILTPERIVVDKNVEYINVPAIEGFIGFLSNHSPFFTELKSGECVIKSDGKYCHYALHEGYISVYKNEVVVVAEAVEHADEIDVERAMREKANAERVLASKAKGPSTRRAQATLERSVTRIRVARKVSRER